MKKDLIRTANNLVSYSSIFRCTLEEAWQKHLPNQFTDLFTFEEVKEYIDEKIKQGSIYLKIIDKK